MDQTVTLRHTNHILPSRVEYFYDGIAVARDGYLTLPAENKIWLKAAYLRGYQCRPDGTRLEAGEFDAYIENQTAKSAEGNTDESIDGRGQSVNQDRVRSRKRNRG